ncbi:hypothetical protein ACJX0J_007465, partial [Zea mays]
WLTLYDIFPWFISIAKEKRNVSIFTNLFFTNKINATANISYLFMTQNSDFLGPPYLHLHILFKGYSVVVTQEKINKEDSKGLNLTAFGQSDSPVLAFFFPDQILLCSFDLVAYRQLQMHKA